MADTEIFRCPNCDCALPESAKINEECSPTTSYHDENVPANLLTPERRKERLQHNRFKFLSNQDDTEKSGSSKTLPSTLLFNPESVFDKIYKKENLGGIALDLYTRSIGMIFLFGLCHASGAKINELLILSTQTPIILIGGYAFALPFAYQLNLVSGLKLVFKQLMACHAVSVYISSISLASFGSILLVINLCASSRLEAFFYLFSILVSSLFGTLYFHKAIGYVVTKNKDLMNNMLVPSYSIVAAVLIINFITWLDPFLTEFKKGQSLSEQRIFDLAPSAIKIITPTHHP